MDLICYIRDGWAPHIRPALATRDWMDATPQSVAYRCLPLNIANAHGWEVLCATGFEAVWNGDPGKVDITITPTDGGDKADLPISLFGSGLLTFHVNGLFRTPPGWNLWIGGSPNRPKDGIAALTGVVDTDWSPYSFTMNWRFTRPHHKIRFEAGEPFCFVFPVQRATLEAVQPRFEDMACEPELQAHFRAWSASRNEFNADMTKPESRHLLPAETWQKRYYRGDDMADQPVIVDHMAKWRLRPFAPKSEPPFDPAAMIAVHSDTVSLGQVMADLAIALNAGKLDDEAGRAAMVVRLRSLGMGASEAYEVLWAAIDRASGAKDSTSAA